MITDELINSVSQAEEIQKEIHKIIDDISKQKNDFSYQDAFNTAIVFKLGRIQARLNEIELNNAVFKQH